MAGVDYYELLDVEPDASQAQIRSAHRTLVKVLHPDAGGSHLMFRLVQEAYETLSDPDRRAAYDLRRRVLQSPNSSGFQWWDQGGEPEEGVEDRDGQRPAGGPQQAAEPVGFASGLSVIPTDSIAWWRTVDPETRVSWRPGFGWAQRWFFAITAVWTVLLIATAVSLSTKGLSLTIAVVTVPVAYLFVTILGKATPKFLSWLIYLWAAGMAGVGIWTLYQGEMSGIGVLLLAGGVFALPPLGRWYLGSRATERIFTPEFRSFNLFGAPGAQLLSADDEPAMDCEAAEWMTLDLLSGYLGQIPAVRIFHGLAWPGSSRPEVDHAVLCGDKLLLIESRIWPPGHYSCDADGVLLRDGATFDGADLRLARTVAAYQMLLPKMDVRGFVLVHPSVSGEVTSAMPADPPIEVMNPEDFVRIVGDWLAREPSLVNREVFLTLLDQVKA
ncbi:MAG: J domain-containing protein [Kutzneria sp.]|nr:J domain-containing protein [Kutzneria sp.]MBV9844625.1 J domain-containing protein [Kutzneria sp.]